MDEQVPWHFDLQTPRLTCLVVARTVPFRRPFAQQENLFRSLSDRFRDMSIRDAVLVQSTSDAPWLPARGLAEVYRSSVAPADASMVRLLIRRDD